ncbi:hypothetical protein [Mesobacillus campisalis]|uniref:hypothetical protein n=1 Tax=Mesobacillus campisalis TaxID=1408103 RepID=UPI00069AB5D4|nr:hypothetical protein [Mesobacillus campisalis]
METKGGKEKGPPPEIGVREAVEPSAYEYVWQSLMGELESWFRNAEWRDDVLIHSLGQYAESVKRNQENIQLVTAQLMKEAAEWERTAREEFLMATTILQHFYPVKSYEEINLLMDRILHSTASILRVPCGKNWDGKSVDKSLEMAKGYMEWRRKARAQYIRQIKLAAGCVYENQKRANRLLTGQNRALFTFGRIRDKDEN